MYCSYIFKFFLIIICILLTIKYVIYKPNMYYYGGELMPYHNNISKNILQSTKIKKNMDKLYTFKYTSQPILNKNLNNSTLLPMQNIENLNNYNNNVQIYPRDMIQVSPPTKYYSYDLRNTPNIIHNTKYPIIYNNNNDLVKYTNKCKIN